MGDRRMFHTAVVESDAFLDLPVGAQALYFHLGMHADDDGFVNSARQVLRKLRRPAKELQQLVTDGFVMDFDGIMVIRHWLVANTLKADRIKPNQYPQIAEKLYIRNNRIYTTQPQTQGSLLDLRRQALESKRNPKVREEKIREEKVREEKVREDKVREDKAAAAAVFRAAEPPTYDDSNFLVNVLGRERVLLTSAQAKDLIGRMGQDRFSAYITRLAKEIIERNQIVDDHYAAILEWWEEDRSVCI